LKSISKSSAGRQAEIDSVRGLAVMMVVLDHLGFSRIWGGFPWGIFGVKLLFLFSGYFLTREAGKNATAEASGLDLRRYYVKRIARLLPICWVVVAVAMLLRLDGAFTAWPSHLLFVTNFQVMYSGEWTGCLSHLWSLSMQMQFYILWPLLLVVLPPRHWGLGMIGAAFVAWGYRTACLASDMPEMVRWLHLPNSLDAFAAGAAVAWIEVFRPAWREGFRRRANWLMALSVAFMAAAYRLRSGDYPAPLQAAMESCECAFVLIVMLSLRWETNLLAPLLRIPPLPALGTISFSLYAFHPLVHDFCMTKLFVAFPAAAAVSWLPQFTVLVLSLLVATAGYYLIEKIAPRHFASLLEWSAASLRAMFDKFQPVAALRSSAGVAILIAFLVAPVMHGLSVRRQELLFGERIAADGSLAQLSAAKFQEAPDEMGPKDDGWKDDEDGDNNFLFPRAIDDGRALFQGHAFAPPISPANAERLMRELNALFCV
jgi:peptidoglycan/LPS O-acetylase OafA/YrhL